MIVYCLTNVVNGKKYVGWTSQTLEQRWKKHVKNALVLQRKFLLSEAIRKHGVDAWKREILEDVLTEHEAKLRESHWIRAFNTNSLAGGDGYNMTDGGDGCRLSGPANPFYGRKHTQASIDAMREKLSLAMSGESNPQFGMRGVLSPNYGRKHSDETRRKISDGQKRRGAISEESRRKMSEAQKRRQVREREDRERIH